MSVVTNLILAWECSDGRESKLAQVNQYITNHERGAGLVSLDDEELPQAWYGGSKMLECELAVGSFNAFHLDAFVAFLKTVEWYSPEAVQVIVKEQEDTRFRIINVFEERS